MPTHDQEKMLATLTWKKVYYVVLVGENAVNGNYLDYINSDKFKEGVNSAFDGDAENVTLYLKNVKFNDKGEMVSYKVVDQKTYENDKEKKVYKVSIKWDITFDTSDETMDLEKAKTKLKENQQLNGVVELGQFKKADKNGNQEVAHAEVGESIFTPDIITLNPLAFKNIDDTRKEAYGHALGHEAGHNSGLEHGVGYPEKGLMSNDLTHSENVKITGDENERVLDVNHYSVKKTN